MIRLEGVCRSYPVGDEEVHALVDVSEEIEAAEHVAIMGPSGSGKSTLLHILGCLDRPSSGSFELLGREVGALTDAELTLLRRHQIGFVFQFFHLVPRLSAVDNVALPLLFAETPRSERLERARAALDGVGLSTRAGHRPDQLSGGERQRVALARATVMEPSLLLADEPTGNLDRRSGRQVLTLLGEMNRRGLTLVVVTHDPGVARRADRVLILVDGRIVKRVPGSEIREAMELLADENGAGGGE